MCGNLGGGVWPITQPFSRQAAFTFLLVWQDRLIAWPHDCPSLWQMFSKGGNKINITTIYLFCGRRRLSRQVGGKVNRCMAGREAVKPCDLTRWRCLTRWLHQYGCVEWLRSLLVNIDLNMEVLLCFVRATFLLVGCKCKWFINNVGIKKASVQRYN
jgi:hypothetical protein